MEELPAPKPILKKNEECSPSKRIAKKKKKVEVRSTPKIKPIKIEGLGLKWIPPVRKVVPLFPGSFTEDAVTPPSEADNILAQASQSEDTEEKPKIIETIQQRAEDAVDRPVKIKVECHCPLWPKPLDARETTLKVPCFFILNKLDQTIPTPPERRLTSGTECLKEDIESLKVEDRYPKEQEVEISPELQTILNLRRVLQLNACQDPFPEEFFENGGQILPELSLLPTTQNLEDLHLFPEEQDDSSRNDTKTAYPTYVNEVGQEVIDLTGEPTAKAQSETEGTEEGHPGTLFSCAKMIS